MTVTSQSKLNSCCETENSVAVTIGTNFRTVDSVTGIQRYSQEESKQNKIKMPKVVQE